LSKNQWFRLVGPGKRVTHDSPYVPVDDSQETDAFLKPDNANLTSQYASPNSSLLLNDSLTVLEDELHYAAVNSMLSIKETSKLSLKYGLSTIAIIAY